MRITGTEFEGAIKKDPSWCKALKEPIEITTYVELRGSNITHLSPLLTFSGTDTCGWVADFQGCKNLKVATGTYKGAVNFSPSGIEKIENLVVNGTDKDGISANFRDCKDLKVAAGTYQGFVAFDKTGISQIKGLSIKNKDQDGEKAWFNDCSISYIPKQYRGKEFKFDEGVIKNSIRIDTIKQIKSETNNITL